MAKPEKKPLIATGVHTEFGEVLDDPTATHLGGQRVDVTYVPGHSERRWERDVAVAEVARGQRSARDVAPLPGNVRWVRRTTANGTPGQSKEVKAGLAGYVPVTDALIGPDQLVTAVPKGATRLPDGTYAMGDVVLMQCDAATAARNTYAKQQRTQARLLGAQEKADAAGVTTEKRLMEPLSGAPKTRFPTQ